MTDIARLVLDADTRGLKNAERELRGVDTQARRTAGEVDRASAGMASAFKRVGAALVAAGITTVLYEFGKQSVRAAIDAEEMGSAFRVVFGDMADDVEAWAERTGNALGRSTQEIMRGALAFQELFGKALDPAQAAEMSKQFAVLTQDLASFKNLSNEVAQQKLFSGLVGEAEPLRAVGVFLNEAAVQAKAAELGLRGVNGVLTDQEKIVARAALIQEQLAQASGDVERTSGSTANQIKTYQAAVEELQVAIGGKLLPTLTPLITATAEVVTSMANAVQGFNGAGVSLGSLMRVVVTAGSAWAAYRLTLLAAQGATLLMNSTLAFNLSVLASTRTALGTAAAAQTALGVATSATAGIFRGFAAALAANPFGAVAVAVGALTAAFVGMGQAQAQARAETDNLVRSLRGLAQARSADFALKRAEVDVERRRLETQLAGIRAEQERIRQSPELAQRGTTNARLKSLENEARGLTWQIIEMEGELGAADKAFEAAQKAAESMVVPVAEAAGAVGSLSKALTGAGDSARAANDDFADMMETLFPENITRRQMQQLDMIEKNAARISNPFEARLRALGVAGEAEVSRELISQGPLEAAKRVMDIDIPGSLKELQNKSKRTTVAIAETFAQMSQRITSSLQGLANSIRSGDFLGILGGVLNLFTSLGSAGVFGKGLQTRLNTPSFDGGGFTGSGARAGGLDGKGGFLAMLHPNETVIDHTRGQRAANDVNITVGVDPRSGNILAFVDGRIAATAPLVANAGAMQAQAMGARSARRRVR